MTWMNDRKRTTTLLAFGLAASLSLTACGEDDDPADSNVDPDRGSNTSSTFDVELSGDGASTNYSGSLANDETSDESWGASIAGGVITILMQDASGVAISAVIDTAQNTYATGDFSVAAPPEGTFVTLLDPLAGQALNSHGQGTIKLTSCPTAMGDKVVGSFQSVSLEDENEGPNRTLTGNFDVAVYAMSGTLNCPPADDTNDNSDDDPDDSDDQPNACQGYEYCENSDGACCPYAQCMATCSFNCVMEDAECAGGLNPAACNACTLGCLDSCGVDQACRDAATALTSCEEDAGCDTLDDEDEAASCTESACCSELQTAY